MVAALIGCTLSELGERMSAEELGWWLAMLETEWIGPQRQSQLLAMIAMGVRNGPVQGPNGKGSLWQLSDVLPADRWQPPPPKSKGPSLSAIKAWFSRFGFK